MACVLCGSKSIRSQLECSDYFACDHCDLIFLNPALRLSPEDEKKHYDNHNNDIHDPRYKKFVDPLFREIIQRSEPFDVGLDYGAGPGPVIAYLLENHKIKVDLYDPYFNSTVSKLERKYNFIYASESVEHFYDPQKEFLNIKNHLTENGFLAVMTHMHTPQIDFKNWYYRKDPTHVCFYSTKTMLWIKEEFGFRGMDVVSDKVVIFIGNNERDFHNKSLS